MPPAFSSLLVLLAFICHGCTGQHGARATGLKAMSFNIRYANAGDAENRWESRRGMVFALIRDRMPDLVGLQEALSGQMSELKNEFPGYRFLGQGRLGGDRGEYSALMVRADRLEVSRHGDFWLSPTPAVVGSQGWDAVLPRMCTWAELCDRDTGNEFLVMNTHFDHRGERARLESALVIAELRSEISALPTILLGDFNADEDSAPIQQLLQAGFRDSFRVLHPNAEQVGTFHGFDGIPERGKIDYVFIDSYWVPLAAEIIRDASEERYPSDHFPVIAELRLR